MMGKRIAIVLFNLGGPDSLEAVQPFLFNLFSDPDIFKFPLGFITQKLFARFMSGRRASETRRGYRAIGGKSPLLDHTRDQAQALQHALANTGDYSVHVCMRYWHPLADQVAQELKADHYDKVLLLPLYPQYSRTTTGSSYNDFRRACKRHDYRPELEFIESWYDHPGYHQAIAESIHREAGRLPDSGPENIELVFSAHGLPQKIVDAGDPYAQQVRATYEAVCAKLNWPHTTLCYQSRVGPLQWLRPYIKDVIQEKAGARQMLVYPIAFVSDHIETLFELGVTYADLAREQGIAHYRVVPALNADPRLIATLRELVLARLNHERQ